MTLWKLQSINVSSHWGTLDWFFTLLNVYNGVKWSNCSQPRLISSLNLCQGHVSKGILCSQSHKQAERQTIATKTATAGGTVRRSLNHCIKQEEYVAKAYVRLHLTSLIKETYKEGGGGEREHRYEFWPSVWSGLYACCEQPLQSAGRWPEGGGSLHPKCPGFPPALLPQDLEMTNIYPSVTVLRV